MGWCTDEGDAVLRRAGLLPCCPGIPGGSGKAREQQDMPECSVEHWPQYSTDLQLGRSLLAEVSTPRKIGISEEPHSWVPELFYLFIFNAHVRCCGF